MPARPKLDGRVEKCAQLLRHDDALFPGFATRAAQAPRYRVGGVAAGADLVGARSAREIWAYYSSSDGAAVLGRHVVHEDTDWTNEFRFPWDGDLNYQTFLKAWQGVPVLFFKAVQVIAAFEAATIALGGGDVYRVMDIIPCSYNVDKFNRRLLDELRQISNGVGDERFDGGALRAMAQTDRQLLDDMAEGQCVTRESARALRKFTKEFIERAERRDLEIGDVRAYPGKKKLGKGRASDLELVDTDTAKP